MKLVCLVGPNVQRVLLPLFQHPELFDGVYFLYGDADRNHLSVLTSTLTQFDTAESGWKDALMPIFIRHTEDIWETYGAVVRIIHVENSRNEEVAVNLSDGRKEMLSGAKLAAKDGSALCVCVSGRGSELQWTSWDWVTHKYMISSEAVNLPPMEVRQYLALCNFSPAQKRLKKTCKGAPFENVIYDAFKRHEQMGEFRSVDRNLVLRWRGCESFRNEIDILFLRKDVVGFVSLKGGSNVRLPAVTQKAFTQVSRIYPRRLFGRPCLRVLISKYVLPWTSIPKMVEDEVLVVDEVNSNQRIEAAVQTVIEAADYMSRGKTQLSSDFYRKHRNELFHF